MSSIADQMRRVQAARMSTNGHDDNLAVELENMVARVERMTSLTLEQDDARASAAERRDSMLQPHDTMVVAAMPFMHAEPRHHNDVEERAALCRSMGVETGSHTRPAQRAKSPH